MEIRCNQEIRQISQIHCPSKAISFWGTSLRNMYVGLYATLVGGFF